MPSPTNDYIEFNIDGRKCYVSQHDLMIFYGIMGHRSGANPQKFHELPDDTNIVRIYLVRKWATNGKPSPATLKRKELGAVCDRSNERSAPARGDSHPK